MGELEKFGIKKVIVIDDNYRSEDFKISDFRVSDIENISNQLSDFSDEISIKDLLDLNKEATINDFYQKNQLDDKAKNEVIDILGDINSAIDRYKILKEDIGESKIVSFDPNEVGAIEKFRTMITESQECTFIVLDKILDENNAAKSQKLLKEVVETINSALKINKLLFMVMYSTDVPSPPKDYEAVKEYLNHMTGIQRDNPLMKSEFPLHINFVDKNEKQEGILSKFTTALRRSQKAAFTTLFDVSFRDSMTKMRERVWELSDNEALFYYNYLNEGQHIDNIIFDIFETNFKNYYNIEKNDNYRDIINPLRKSAQIFGRDITSQDNGNLDYSKRLRVIKQFDYFFKNNGQLMKVAKSDDISFGDVISINDEEYVIVSQDCDTTVRYESKRKLDSITLLKLKKDDMLLSDKLSEIIKDAKKGTALTLSRCFKEIFFSEAKFEGQNCLKNLGIDLTKAQEFANLKDGNKTQFKNSLAESMVASKKITEYSVAAVPNIYTLSSFWLDVLLIRSEELSYSTDDPETLIVTSEAIEESKELRYSTQIKLLKEFEEELNKFTGLEKEMIEKILNTQIFNNLLNITPFFDGEEKLLGFKIENYKRIGHKDVLSTMELYDSALNHQTRIARNLEMIF
ncbi:hypothetical protein [Lactococcus lactis]|uniref:hypothetical protein n=1 Tax=Lactococcus lactis TaxID=1358 RepID=UPI0024164769|nr:hypothetical protein [Lactococcus lactis]MDG4967591.1 hypothetical protein [Lactococcus lactis]MDG5101919.1 hypothetical protein [Lactococcus lactis]